MPRTVMFIHGMFLNPKSWEGWQQFFGDRGYHCVAPAWPLHDGDPRTLRATQPPGLGELSLDAVYERMLAEARKLDDPILIGHSVGGLLVQKLVAAGAGSLGVPICSVAPNRMLSLDWGFFRNSLEITNPLKGDAPFPMDADGFFQNFANTMTRAASDAAFEQLGMQESRNVLRDCMGDAGKVDLDRPHVPLFFVAAEKDEIIPPQLCRKNAEAHGDAGSVVEFEEFAGRGHFICGQPGWEEVATRVEAWIRSHDAHVAPAPRARPAAPL